MVTLIVFAIVSIFPINSLVYDWKPSKINPIALRKAKIGCNFGLSECKRVKRCQTRVWIGFYYIQY